MAFVARVREQSFTVAVHENGHVRRVTLDGSELEVDWQPASPHVPNVDTAAQTATQYTALVGGQSYNLYIRPVPSGEADGDGTAQHFEVMIDGRPYVVALQDERSQALASIGGGAHVSGDVSIRAPMPGLVSNVMKEEGQEVRRGDTVIVLEAMKMENDLTTPRPGIVKSVRVRKGQTVNQGDVLAVVGDITTPTSDDEDDDSAE